MNASGIMRPNRHDSGTRTLYDSVADANTVSLVDKLECTVTLQLVEVKRTGQQLGPYGSLRYILRCSEVRRDVRGMKLQYKTTFS